MDKQSTRRRNRGLRAALVLGATLITTGVVGYGGLAAWQAYTDNPNSVAAQSLGHYNTVVSSSSCTSVSSTSLLIPTGQSGACAFAIDIGAGANAISPDSPATLASGKVEIVNTGQLASNFYLSMLNAPAVSPTPGGNLCADMLLTVTDLNTKAPDTGTVYAATALSTQITTPIELYNNAATPSYSWTGSGTAPGGTGATGNTFTITLTKGPNFNTDSQDQGNTCSFDLLFSQEST
jgi:hypothetical protein